MHSYHEESMHRLYPLLIKECMQWGKPYSPRSFNCVELRPAHFSLGNPKYSLYQYSDRRLNYRFFAIETLGYLAGLDAKWYMDLLCDSNSRFEAFRDVDNGSLLWGYGPRLSQSLDDVVIQLRKDPSSRQCVSAIWSPGLNDKICANTPCTVSLNFFASGLIGSGWQLSCLAHMRSNDLDWGVPYDVPAFCSIQMAVAGCLGWDMGIYHHLDNSLHLYTDHIPNANCEGKIVPGLELPELRGYSSMGQLKHDCLLFLGELHSHRRAGGKWKEFKPTMTTPYFNWWLKLIRFNWSDFEAEQVAVA